jgi:hypothetical protein
MHLSGAHFTVAAARETRLRRGWGPWSLLGLEFPGGDQRLKVALGELGQEAQKHIPRPLDY